jgi:alkylhydroperoxidase family enzyme
MTVTGEKVTDELFARLRGHFSEAQIVELTAVVALDRHGQALPGTTQSQPAVLAEPAP